MVTNGSAETSSGTGWKRQTCTAAVKHFEVSPDFTSRSSPDNDHRYYRCNLGKVMNEREDDTWNQTRWKSRAARNNFESSDTSISTDRRIDDGFNAVFHDASSFADVTRIICDLIEQHYGSMKNRVSAAVDDIRRRWIATDGTHFHRAKVVNKLIGYYLISMAIYMIELSFWTNGKLFRLLGNLILEPRDKIQAPIALCIVAVFVFVVYLLGGEGTLFAPSACENEAS